MRILGEIVENHCHCAGHTVAVVVGRKRRVGVEVDGCKKFYRRWWCGSCRFDTRDDRWPNEAKVNVICMIGWCI